MAGQTLCVAAQKIFHFRFAVIVVRLECRHTRGVVYEVEKDFKYNPAEEEKNFIPTSIAGGKILLHF